jgi:hypothetical protein
MFFPPISDEYASFFLLGGSAVAGYAAVRALVDALPPSSSPAPVRHAIVHASMTAIVCVAALLHRPALLDVAVGVPFSTAVAAMTLALGVVLFVAPAFPTYGSRAHGSPRQTSASGAGFRGAWAFLLPTGLLTLLIGFSGRLSTSSGLILAAEGAAILLVSRSPRSRTKTSSILSGESDSSERAPAVRRHPALSFAQAVLAVLLMLLAGWGLVQGAGGMALHNPAFRPGVAAVLALGPAIVLPMIPPLATLAERGRRDEATSAVVAFALINLCAVLPMVVVAQRLTQFASASAAATQPSLPTDLPFPILVWRLATVLLSTVGLLLLPTAIGRWTLARAEGLGLVGLYVIYLFLTLLISNG